MKRPGSDDPPVGTKLQRFESDSEKMRYINAIIIIKGSGLLQMCIQKKNYLCIAIG